MSESKLASIKQEINSPEELIALFEQDTLRNFSFDSGRMQLHIIFEIEISPRSKRGALQIWTGNWYGFSSQEDGYFLRKQLFKSFLRKALSHPEVNHVHLSLDIADVYDAVITLKHIWNLELSQRLRINYTLDFCSPKYLVSKNMFPQSSSFTEINSIVAPHFIRNLFSGGLNLRDSYSIYTNTPSTQLELLRAIAQKPCYKHKKSITTAAAAKLIFILADYLFFTSSDYLSNYVFYQNLFLASHRVFLWTGDPRKLVHIKKQEEVFRRLELVAQPENSINIEAIRTSLSHLMPMHDKKIVVMTAEKRIAAINSILDAIHKKADHPQTPATHKERLAYYERPQAILTISENAWRGNQYIYENNLKDTSFTTLEIDFPASVARMECLFKAIGKNNLINRVHFKNKPLDFEFFNIILKNCLSLQMLRLDQAENQIYMGQLSDEVAAKVTEILFNGYTGSYTLNLRPNLSLFNRFKNLRELTLERCTLPFEEFPFLPNLLNLNFINCSFYSETFDSGFEAFKKIMEKLHPKLLITITNFTDKLTQTASQLSTSDFRNNYLPDFIPSETTDETPPYNPSSLYLPKTTEINTNSIERKCRFYTNDPSLTLPPARMDQDEMMQLTIQPGGNKSFIGFMTSAIEFIAEPEQKKFHRYTYNQYTSLEKYQALEKDLKLPKAVCGRIDSVQLDSKSVYVLPTPLSTPQQSWALATIAFELPKLADMLEIGHCPSLQNAYALRLKDTTTTSQIIKAYMILYPAIPSPLPLKIPEVSSFGFIIKRMLLRLASNIQIKKDFPNFVQLIAQLEAIEKNKIALKQAKSNPMAAQIFWQYSQEQIDLIVSYCRIKSGVKADNKTITFTIEELQSMEKFQGMKEFIINLLLPPVICERAAQSAAFLATGYHLPNWVVNSQEHAYLKILSAQDAKSPTLSWQPKDLGGAAVTVKEIPFFSESLSLRLNDAKELKSFAKKPRILKEFAPIHHWSFKYQGTIFDFINQVFSTDTPSLIFYPANNLKALEGFLALLCDHYREQHATRSTHDIRSSYSGIMQPLNNRRRIAFLQEEEKRTCWIKIVEHPDDLTTLWEMPSIPPKAMKATPLQNKVPTLLIINIDKLVSQLEIQSKLFKYPPCLSVNSQLLMLPTTCRIIYLGSHLPKELQNSGLQFIDWPSTLESEFLKIRQQLPLAQQLDANTSLSTEKTTSKSPTTDSVICDLKKSEPENFLSEKLLVRKGQITLQENSIVSALKAHKPVTLAHCFTESNWEKFCHLALCQISIEQHALEDGQYSPLPIDPAISIVRHPTFFPTRLTEIDDTQWATRRTDQTVTSYILTQHSYPSFIANWQADVKKGSLLSTELPGLLHDCKTAKALIQVTDSFSEADWITLYQHIAEVPEHITLEIWFHPRYRNAPGLPALPPEEKRLKDIPKEKSSQVNTPKVFFAPNADLLGALQQLKILKLLPADIHCVPINSESTLEELLESIQTRVTESSEDCSFTIKYQKGQVMTRLEKSEPVLLVGEISRELYSQLESLLISDYLWSNAQRQMFSAPLFLLSPPNPQLAQHLETFFDTETLTVDYLQWLEQDTFMKLEERDKRHLQQIYQQTKGILRWSWPRLQEISEFLQKYPPEKRAEQFELSPFQTKLLEDYNPQSAIYQQYRDLWITLFCSTSEIKKSSTKEPEEFKLTPPLLPDSSPLLSCETEPSSDDKKQSVDSKVKQALMLLENHDSLALLGSAGTGKTFTARVLVPQALQRVKKPYRLYIGDASIQPWLKSDDPKFIHILLLDEINALPSSLLQPLLWPGSKHWQGEVYAHKAPHWLIGTANPRLAYLNRFPVPEDMPTLWFQPFTHEDIRDQQILPFLTKVLHIVDSVTQQDLADTYLKGYEFLRNEPCHAVVSPRNLNRILMYVYAKAAPHLDKNLAPTAESLQQWMKEGCYLEFNSLLPADGSKTKLQSELLTALGLTTQVKLPTVTLSQETLNQYPSLDTSPLQELMGSLVTTLQIRELTIQNKLEPSGYGMLFQGFDTEQMHLSVRTMLEHKKLPYVFLSVNPLDETNFKDSIRKALDTHCIIILENPHLITGTLEKWLNSLLEGMDVEQPLETFPAEFFMIFLHKDNKPLSIAIKNRLQVITLNECYVADWKKILQNYTQNPALSDLIIASFTMLLEQSQTVGNIKLRNPADLIQLCNGLQAQKWFEKTSTEIQVDQLYENIIRTFYLYANESQQLNVYNNMLDIISIWCEKFPADKKLTAPNKNISFKYQTDLTRVYTECQFCLETAAKLLMHEQNLESATAHLDLAKKLLLDNKIINLEILQALRDSYYQLAIYPSKNNAVLIKQNSQSALLIDSIIETYAGKSSKVQIKEKLKEYKITTADEDSRCLIM
ncbi:MAG TPA: hypothetical protein VHE99_11995 [Gammaproteobacteria bacterium]|nr:hypothetical protein [Gammaproteobacteria bacterium]